MKKKITAAIMTVVMIIGMFGGSALTASAEQTRYPVGAAIVAQVDTGTKTLSFIRQNTASNNKMNEITIGAAPWKDLAEQIEHVNIGEGIVNLTAGSCCDLPNLKDIAIGKDVADISDRAFLGCPSIREFIVDTNNKSYKTIFSRQILTSKDGSVLVRAATGMLTSYVIPSAAGEKIIRVENYAFSDAAKLERITIGSSVTYIGDYAFAGCPLKGSPSDNDEIRNLVIPSNVRIIGSYAFANTLIRETSFSSGLNTIGEGAFSNCEELTKIAAVENPVMAVGSGAFTGTNKAEVYSVMDFNGSSDEWSTMTKSDAALARWKHSLRDPQDTEYIVYDVNGGSVATIPQNQYFDKKLDKEVAVNPLDAAGDALTPIYPGKFFAGWSTEPLDKVSSSTVLYQAGDIFPKEGQKLKASVRLYAAWTDDITLTFDPNGGSLVKGLSPVVFKEVKDSYTLPTAVPENEKYDFVGWSRSKDAASAEYSAGGKIKIDTNITLYAVWNTDGPFSVTFNANGGKLADGKTTKTVAGAKAKDTDYTITEGAPSRSRYEFIGWAESAGGAVKYKPDNSVKVTANNNITLYAKWKFNGPCYIRYNIDGSADQTKSQDVPIGTEITVEQAAEKSGYVFAGWSYGGKTYKPGDKITASSDITFTARFEKIYVAENMKLSISRPVKVSVGYGSKVRIKVTVTDAPDDTYQLWIYDSRNKSGEGVAGTEIKNGTGTVEWTSDRLNEDVRFFIRVIDKTGAIVEKSDTERFVTSVSVDVNTGFFSRIIGFFKGLFNIVDIKDIA